MPLHMFMRVSARLSFHLPLYVLSCMLMHISILMDGTKLVDCARHTHLCTSLCTRLSSFLHPMNTTRLVDDDLGMLRSDVRFNPAGLRGTDLHDENHAHEGRGQRYSECAWSCA